jgi:hypothetical protein
MSRSIAKQSIESWNSLFTPYFNTSMWIRFNNHAAKIVIQEIKLAATTKMKADKQPIPDMRQSEDQKQYTPFVLNMICDSCVLSFVIEDCEIVVIMGGIEITCGGLVIRITKE